MNELKDFLSAKELAEVLEVTIDTVLDWREKGLPFYRIGKRVWFEQHEVAAFMMTHLKGETMKPTGGQTPIKAL
jgi:excisionase family DNA binding protein